MRLGALAAALLVLCIGPAFAEERITDYSSDITVAQTGALTVTETISVIAEGDEIRHGIFREFPTIYKDKTGRTVHVGFDVLRRHATATPSLIASTRSTPASASRSAIPTFSWSPARTSTH